MDINEILAEMTFLPEEGSLKFQGVRYLLIRPETLVSLQKALEQEVGPERTAEILYTGGFTGGQLSGRKYMQTFGLSEPEAVAFMCRMGAEIGWGNFHVVALDPDQQQLIVEVAHSPFAEAYGESEAEVCHLIRGVLGGLGAGVFGAPVEANESRCLTLGDPTCRFEVVSVTPGAPQRPEPGRS